MFELHEVFPLSEIKNYKVEYVSMISQNNEKWIICHHHELDKWDFPGGRIEQGEIPIEAAMREMYEETGVVESDYIPLFIYCIKTEKGFSYGIQYFCDIVEFEQLPDFEIDKIEFHKDVHFDNFRNPEAQRQLFRKVKQILDAQLF